jgi:phosphonate transport system substrate-binding protein
MIRCLGIDLEKGEPLVAAFAMIVAGMIARIRRETAARGVALLLALAAGVAHAEIRIPFGVYAADKPETVTRQFRPLLDAIEVAMSRRLGQPVHIHMNVADSYEEGLAALRAGKVHFARFGPATYVAAREAMPDLRLLAMETNQGEKYFLGAIVVHGNSPIRKIEDLKGKSFAFGDENSTIGRYLAQHLLHKSGISARDLGRYVYMCRHDAVGEAVARGDYDAGALKQGTIKTLVARGLKLRPLLVFRNITKPWIAHPDLPDELYQALRETMLNLKDDHAFENLASDGANGFAPAEDAEYDPIRNAIKRNPEFFQ